MRAQRQKEEMLKDRKTDHHQKNYHPSDRNPLREGREKEVTKEKESTGRNPRLIGPHSSLVKINLLFKKNN